MMGPPAISTAAVLAGSAAARSFSWRLLTAAALILVGAGLMYLAWQIRKRRR